AVGIGPRDVEGFDAARAAEVMPGDAGVERIQRQFLPRGEQPEARCGHDQVQIAEPGAHRAVALEHLDVARRVDLEAHSAAVAAPTVTDQLWHGLAIHFSPPRSRTEPRAAGAA